MRPSVLAARRVLLLWSVLVLDFLPNAQAQRGAITVPRDLVQLTDRAARVVHGRVIYARVEAHPQYRNLSSVLVVMSVADVLKGKAAKTLTFRQFIWDPRDRADRAGYRQGEELVLFLNRVTAAGFTSPVGLEQGRFRVLRKAVGEPMVLNGAGNNALFQGARALSIAPKLSLKARQTLARNTTKAGPIPLDVLREVVHTVVAELEEAQ